MTEREAKALMALLGYRVVKDNRPEVEVEYTIDGPTAWWETPALSFRLYTSENLAVASWVSFYESGRLPK